MGQGAGHWWGDYSVALEERVCWHLGGLRLWVQRGTREWCVSAQAEASGEATAFQRPCPEPPPVEASFRHRIACEATGNRIALRPRLPDRPLVWRPPVPFTIAPHQEVTLYLRVPLWLALLAEAAAILCELPLRRLRDTWFGDPAEGGGYAYRADPDVVLDEAQLPRDPLHAIVPITLHNSAAELLRLERLHLPVPYLALFVGGAGGVWTPRIALESDHEAQAPALLRLGQGAPREARGGELLAPPRIEADQNLVFEAFSRIFR